MSSHRPAKQQWSTTGHGRVVVLERWGESSGFNNGQTNSNSWGASSNGNTGHVTNGQGYSTFGQIGVQWNSSNSQAGQNQGRGWGSRYGQGAASNHNRKVTLPLYYQYY